MSKDKLKIVGYCRESTMVQFEQGFNIDDQEKKIRQYVDVYYPDGNYELSIQRDGASAKSLNRPCMNAVIRQIKAGKVDVFIVHNLDRMTRRIKDLSSLLDLFQAYKVQLISITEKIDTETPMGMFFIYLIVLIAQWEQDTIASRSLRGMIESVRQGNYVLPGAPFGYIRNPEDNHHLLIVEEEAKIVRMIYEYVGSDKLSVETVRNHLLSMGVKLDTWKIRRILENKIYYGTLVFHEVEYPNIAPPIITKEIYDKAHVISGTGMQTMRKHEYIFKNMIICENCGKLCRCDNASVKRKYSYLYHECPKCLKRVNDQKLLALVNLKMKTDSIIEKDADDLTEMESSEARSLVNQYIDRINYNFKKSVFHIEYKEDQDNRTSI